MATPLLGKNLLKEWFQLRLPFSTIPEKLSLPFQSLVLPSAWSHTNEPNSRPSSNAPPPMHPNDWDTIEDTCKIETARRLVLRVFSWGSFFDLGYYRLRIVIGAKCGRECFCSPLKPHLRGWVGKGRLVLAYLCRLNGLGRQRSPHFDWPLPTKCARHAISYKFSLYD